MSTDDLHPLLLVVFPILSYFLGRYVGFREREADADWELALRLLNEAQAIRRTALAEIEGER